MIDYIWNKINDLDLIELPNCFFNTSKKFAISLLNCADFSVNSEIKSLINNKSMNRFEAITKKLSTDLNKFCVKNKLLEDEDLGEKIMLWILLGSITEFVLQSFLTIYIDNFDDSKWQQWENFNAEKVKKKVVDFFNNLVKEGFLDSVQGLSLKNAFKSSIKKHTTYHSIEKIMLDELIQFYIENKIVDKDEITLLRKIQQNRNCIHSYMDRDIGTWQNLQYSVRFLVYLMESFIERLPDVDCEMY